MVSAAFCDGAHMGLVMAPLWGSYHGEIVPFPNISKRKDNDRIFPRSNVIKKNIFRGNHMNPALAKKNKTNKVHHSLIDLE